MFSAMAFAVIAIVVPSRNSTSNIRVSKIGLLCAIPTGFPFSSLMRFVTRAKAGSSPSLGSASSMFRYESSITSGVKSSASGTLLSP